ncbi:TIGR03619 family F420-dependent LLM class oxidoreductase [Rhodococcus sp. CX]|nr:TIGR03619 family F420-dependent LLM class oxidoreductase [Rhodococcus sp. CX]
MSLLRVHPALWRDVAVEAEAAGFESIWMSDHLVLPDTYDPGECPDGELPIRQRTPMYDVMVYLASLAAVTSRLRLGTYVYQLALRNPFVAARAITTLDVVSDGRVELGIGAGWSGAEWSAMGLNFHTRGKRLDESLDVLDGLWTEDTFAYSGEHFDFPCVALEPKPVQRPRPPVHIGGEAPASLRRAARRGDGWIGMHHTPETVAVPIARLTEERRKAGRTGPFVTTAAAHPGPVDVEGWRRSGIDRVIVSPWTRSSEAVEGIRAFADRHLN